jgi:hypothetical protein
MVYLLMEKLRFREFENRVLWRILESMREKLRRGRRHLHKKDPLHFYSPPNIVTMIKSRREGMWYSWEGIEMRVGVWRQILKERITWKTSE